VAGCSATTRKTDTGVFEQGCVSVDGPGFLDDEMENEEEEEAEKKRKIEEVSFLVPFSSLPPALSNPMPSTPPPPHPHVQPPAP
jgi:hypothetical protein